MMLTEEEINNARATLDELRVEHRDLNLVVEHLVSTPLPEAVPPLPSVTVTLMVLAPCIAGAVQVMLAPLPLMAPPVTV